MHRIPLALAVQACLLALACGDPAPDASSPAAGAARYRVSSFENAQGAWFLRVDSSTCRLWQVPVGREHWRPIAASASAPGEGQPVQPGRYSVRRVASGGEERYLCIERATGAAWLLATVGRPRWVPVLEPVHAAGLLDREPPDPTAEAPSLSEAPDPAATLGALMERDDVPAGMRALAAEQLGSVGQGATEPLVRALGDPDPAVVVAAIRALQINGDPGAVPALRALLDHEDGGVRTAAAETLAALSQPGARPRAAP